MPHFVADQSLEDMMASDCEQEAREEHSQRDYSSTQKSVSDTVMNIATLKADEGSKDY